MVVQMSFSEKELFCPKQQAFGGLLSLKAMVK